MVSPFAKAQQAAEVVLRILWFGGRGGEGVGDRQTGRYSETALQCILPVGESGVSRSKGHGGRHIHRLSRWPTVRSIEPLEKELGVPVVTSAQAAAWKALTMLGIHEVPAVTGSFLQASTLPHAQ